MTIQREGKFLIDRFRGTPGTVARELPEYNGIGLESGQLQACIEEAKRVRYEAVFGSPEFGFHESALDALRHLPWLKALGFWDVKVTDIDAIYDLQDLRYFRVQPKRPPIDFSRLPSLRDIDWSYPHKKDTGIGALKGLKSMAIWHYNPKDRRFSGMDIPATVEDINFNFVNVTSFEGFPVLPSLKRLEISYMRNLPTIAEVERFAPNVEHLVVSCCSKISDGEALMKRLPKLSHGYVQGVLFRDGKRIE